MVNVMLAALTGVLAGGCAGRIGHRLLVAMRRGVRPPGFACAAGVAGLWAVVATRLALGVMPPWWAPVPMVLGLLVVLLSVCDVLAARLPDLLTLSAYPLAALVLGLAAHLGQRPALVTGALVGSAVYGGAYALIRTLSPRSMGPGDVKLAGSLGAFAGSVSLAATVLSMLAAAVVTLMLGWRRRGGIPHGPAMLAPVWFVTAFAWSTPGPSG